MHTTEEDADLLLGQAGRDAVREQIEAAWKEIAPKKRVTAHRAARSRRAKQPPITQDDMRRAILASFQAPLKDRSGARTSAS